MKLITQNLKIFFGCFVFSSAVFLLFPLSVIAENVDHLTFPIKDVLPILAIFTVVGSVVFTLLTRWISGRLKYLPLLLTTLLAGLWIQGNIIHYNLGLLDGHTIDWSGCFKQIWIEILVWAALFTLAILFRKVLLRNHTSILVFLLLFTLPNLFLLIKNSSDLPKKLYLDPSGEFQFSENNVIVIILDNFKSAAFQPILEEHPEFQDAFKDFIFFEDAIGGYTSTEPSIPYILTGQYYTNLVPVQDYLNSIESSTISYQLKTQGFRVENYPYVPFFSILYDNQTDRLPVSERYELATQQILAAGVRYSPLILKPWFVARYYYGTNYVHKDLVTFNSRVHEAAVNIQQPTFKLIHLSGVHAPYQLDSSLDWKNADYLEQAAGSLLAVRNLLDELVNAGVYDQSLIFILGDHGALNSQGPSSFPLASHSQPLLLAKKAFQQFESLQISDAPVTLGDIPKTIAEETGLSADFDGYSLFGIIPETRVREYYYHTWSQEYWSTEYLPPLYEFELEGPAGQPSSWKYTGQYVDGRFISIDEINESDLVNFLLEKP